MTHTADERMQVKTKATTVTGMLNQLSAVQRAYAYLQLAKRFLLQCETQVWCIIYHVQL